MRNKARDGCRAGRGTKTHCAFAIDVEFDNFDVRNLGEGAFHSKFPGGRKTDL
jgi:hypothetical protein